jgi:hypothetical protein
MKPLHPLIAARPNLTKKQVAVLEACQVFEGSRGCGWTGPQIHLLAARLNRDTAPRDTSRVLLRLECLGLVERGSNLVWHLTCEGRGYTREGSEARR